jgi:hypothetical protein
MEIGDISALSLNSGTNLTLSNESIASGLVQCDVTLNVKE